MNDAMVTRTVEFPGYGGSTIEAYYGTPADGTVPRGSVVVIHHLPGYDRATKEIVRRVVELGYSTVMPNLYCHLAPGVPPLEASAQVAASGGVPDEQILGDVEGALRFLRAQPESNGKVGAIGFCSGGRQALLAGCSLPLDAVVNCYGGAVLRPPTGAISHLGKTMTGLQEFLPELGAPVLGFFGNDDTFPFPDEVDELESLLAGHGKQAEFHRYDGVGHSFFASDRGGFDVAAAADGWKRIEEFFGRTLGAPA